MSEDVNIYDIDRKLNMTGYTRNNVRSYGHQIADVISKIEILSSAVDEKIMGVDVYEGFVKRQKVEIKNSMAEIFATLQLGEVEGSFDMIFRSGRDGSNDK